MSLRVRLVLATGIVVLVGLVVLDAVTYTLVTRSQLAQVDATLQRAHTPIEQIATSSDESTWRIIPEIAPGLFVAILDEQNQVALAVPARSPGEGDATVDLSAVDLGQGTQSAPATDGDLMRLRVDPIQGGMTIVVGESLHEVSEAGRRLLAVLLGASGIALAAVMASAWWLIEVGLRPLLEVEASAASITDDGLGDRRVPGDDQPTEVGNLARALNAMLNRLDLARDERERSLEELRASEARMRQFVADASHELRTPIAATAAYAELFQQGARDRPEDLERAMAGIRNETSRMGELVDDLLLLARLDERRPLAFQAVDLTEVVLSAVDAARLLEPDRPIVTKIDGVITIDADGARIRQVVDNLLANVRAHTPPTTQCSIHLFATDSHAVLEIADTGPGVPDKRLPLLFDRFYRIDEARTRATGGTGLGLSIVEAIIRAHGGSIEIGRGEPQGLIVTVRLPLDRG